MADIDEEDLQQTSSKGWSSRLWAWPFLCCFAADRVRRCRASRREILRRRTPYMLQKEHAYARPQSTGPGHCSAACSRLNVPTVHWSTTWRRTPNWSVHSTSAMIWSVKHWCDTIVRTFFFLSFASTVSLEVARNKTSPGDAARIWHAQPSW